MVGKIKLNNYVFKYLMSLKGSKVPKIMDCAKRAIMFNIKIKICLSD